MLLESFLDGPEVSLFCVVDGETVVPLLAAQDFKRVGDGDTGPNTGGMGAYAPLPWLPEDVYRAIVGEIVKPVAAEMVRRGKPFSGLLYAGLAITSKGPAVIEFNCRFGDPETQSVLALLDSPLGQLLYAAATGTLARFRRVTLARRRGRDRGAGSGILSGPAASRRCHCRIGSRRRSPCRNGPSRRRHGGLVRWTRPVGGGPRTGPGRGALGRLRHPGFDQLPGSHFRTDIGSAAAEGKIRL